MRFGYARCSTDESKQDISRQIKELQAMDVSRENIYLEYASGSSDDRVELKRLLAAVGHGDTIVATEVSRITRSKLFINTNYLPAVSDVTLFDSGRIRIIPFERHFAENEQDRSLKAYFARPENLSAILNWAIDGLKAYKEMGLAEPDAVKEATDMFRQASDKVTLFLNERAIADEKAWIPVKDAYSAYKTWCIENGYLYAGSQTFRVELKRNNSIARKRPMGSGNNA